MRYVQLVDFDTSHPVYAVQQARDAWSAASRDKRTLHRAVTAAGHDRAHHYREPLEHTSKEEAAKTAGLPGTRAAYDRRPSLLHDKPTFPNLHVVEQVAAPDEQVGAPDGPVDGLGPPDTSAAG